MNSLKSSLGSDLHFSDVIDVIEHDPDYELNPQQLLESTSHPTNTNSGTAKRVKNSSSNPSEINMDVKQRAHVKILEQPASKALRFRSECEVRSAGSIPGANSSSDTKTYPTIQVVGYQGKAVVVVSCVTKDSPHKPHPHSLVGKEGCKKGVCTLEINNENMICTFSNLGIQCVKKKGIEEALKLREDIRVDPFHTGFSHRNQPQVIDLNAVRLCFQVFLEGSQRGKFTQALKPLVSDVIYDKKAMCDLTICKLSDCSSSVSGGKEIILLCDKITKDDIQIVFYQEEDGCVVWEANGEFNSSDVHKQVAVSFRTPAYKVTDVDEPVQAYIQLRRPSDGATSEPRHFQYLPLDSDAEILKRKRQRLIESNGSRRIDFLRDNIFETHDIVGQPLQSPSGVNPLSKVKDEFGGAISRPVRPAASRHKIKREPSDSQSPQLPAGMPAGMPAQYSLNLPMAANYGASPSVSPQPPYQNFYGVSPSSVSPQPPYQNYSYMPSSGAAHYNIPPQASQTPLANLCIDLHQYRDTNIMDIENLNVPQQQQMFDVLDDSNGIQLPLTDSNINMIDSHMFSNLSIHNEDTTDDNQASTNNALPEFPTFSGIFSSTDLDGALDRITSTSKQ